MASYDNKIINGQSLKYFLDKVKALLNGKQDTLTAGENITIENNVISAAGADWAASSGEEGFIENKPFDAFEEYTGDLNLCIDISGAMGE